MPDLDAGWPPGSQDAIGQAAEFFVWAPLITQSGGGLHVFLPMLDRGIDAVIHRLADGAYLALQVKGKTALHGAEAPIEVYENHLFTPDQLVIGVHLDGDRLGPFALVADDNETNEVLIRRLATGATLGIQVKTGQLPEPHAYRKILVNRSNFVAAPTTFVVALAWIVPERRFHETCLVIPSEVVPALASINGPNYELHFRPAGSSRPSRLDRYRVPLESLAETFAGYLTPAQTRTTWRPGTPS
jgi:hypothetical protein